MADNGKVRFGLSKLYYAVLTEGATNAWATPVAIPGAVSMDLENNGTDNTFYADNVAYYKSSANNGYTVFSDLQLRIFSAERTGLQLQLFIRHRSTPPSAYRCTLEHECAFLARRMTETSRAVSPRDHQRRSQSTHIRLPHDNPLRVRLFLLRISDPHLQGNTFLKLQTME